MYFGSLPGLGEQLHRWLEEVHVQPHIIIKSFQALIRRFRGISVIPHQTAHYIPILLLYIAAIVLFVGTRPGKGNLLLAAVGIEALVNEFAAVI